MMLTRLDGDGEVGIAVIGAHPRSVQCELRRWIGQTDTRTRVHHKINPRLPRFGLH